MKKWLLLLTTVCVQCVFANGATIKEALHHPYNNGKMTYVQYADNAPITESRPLFVTHSQALPPFNTLVLYGDVSAQVIANQPQNKIIVSGTPAAVKNFAPMMNQQSLSIHSAQPISVTIYTRQLNTLHDDSSAFVNVSNLQNQAITVTTAGSGNLKIHGQNIRLNSLIINGGGNVYIGGIVGSDLSVYDQGNGLIRLRGVINLAKLYFNGSGRLQLYWLKAHNITADIHGSGSVSIAGTANLLNTQVHDTAQLDARYLRTNTVFVKTSEYSKADVWARINLFALAVDHSDIYYYNQPRYKSRMMRQLGSILSMNYIPNALVYFERTFGLPSATI